MLQSVQSDTLCMDTRFQSFPPLVNGPFHDALLQSSPRLNKPLLENDFIWHSPGTVATVCGWGGQTYNLLTNIKFLQDTVCQNWLKSVYFWRSYSKNKNVSVFWDTVYLCIFICNHPYLFVTNISLFWLNVLLYQWNVSLIFSTVLLKTEVILLTFITKVKLFAALSIIFSC